MRPALFLAASALIAASTGTHAAPLTYAAALDLAARSAPSLQAKAADFQAAQSSAVAAGRLPDPKIRFGLDNFPVSGPPAGRFGPDSMTSATVGVTQETPSGAKRSAERERAAADIGAAQAGQAVEARTVRLNTALAWIDLHFAQRRLVALDDAGRAIAVMRAAAPSQIASGSARPGQTLEPEQLQAALGDRRADLVSAVAKARATLGRWTGDPEPDAAGDPPDTDVNEAALRAGLDDHSSLRAYDASLRQAEADVDMAKAGKRSDWAWDLAYQHRDPRWGDMVTAGVTVSLPLFASTRQDPVIAARVQTMAGVRSQKEAARRELQASLAADLADHAMHHDRLHRAQQTLVPLAQRRSDLETTSYAAGTAGLSDALAAQLALAEAHIDALDREADVARDGVRITLTYGADPR
jgi:cobalt-zinc-cadmium efflux system outer membrane protein